MSQGPFGGRRGAALAAAALGSLAATGLMAGFGDVLWEPASAGADAFSRSATGHRAFLELLRGLGRPVLVSRHATRDAGVTGAAVALLEPELAAEGESAREAAAIAGGARAVLVVLPKRLGVPDPVRPGWLARAEPGPPAAAERVLEALGIEGEVVRPAAAPARWTGPLPAPAIDGPQLVRSAALAPLVACEDGLLAGELHAGGRRVVVLADPDVLATHGLGRGRNAELAVALVDRLGPPDLPLAVDETLHGHALRPSLLLELVRFPLALVTAQALLAGALLAWAALVRFGRPVAAPAAAPRGKDVLVEHTAGLLRRAGHAADAARAHLRGAREAVLAARRPPPGADPDAWLARVEAARGRAGALAALEARGRALGGGRAGAEAALRLARDVHRWREELSDGHPVDPRRHRPPPG